MGGSSGVLENFGPGLSKDWMASACLLLDEQSFSIGLGDAAAESGSWDEMVAGHLHAAI